MYKGKEKEHDRLFTIIEYINIINISWTLNHCGAHNFTSIICSIKTLMFIYLTSCY